MRLRRSSSTPSDTRPATSRRATEKREPDERGDADVDRVAPQLLLVAGLNAVDRLAREPGDRHRGDHRERREHERPDGSRAVGAEEAEQAPEDAHATTGYGARFGYLRARMTDAIALRNRFAMVKGAWDDHLRGVPFPSLGEGTRGGEDRAARARARRRDAQPRHAGDRGAGRRRDVGPRPRPSRRGSRQAARHGAPRGAGAPGPSPDLARGSYPGQAITGSCGYFAKRGSVRAFRHMEKTEPRPVRTSFWCTHSAHSPAGTELRARGAAGPGTSWRPAPAGR